MKETRRLDILALIGGSLALVILIGLVYWWATAVRATEGYSSDRARESLLRRMPDTHVRADFEVLSDQNLMDNRASAQKVLERALKRFPNSARLNLRLGSVGKGASAVKALRRAAELDPRNALPLYLLAAEAASREDWDSTLDLLKRGNRLKRSTAYPLPYEDIDVRRIGEGLELTFLDSHPVYVTAKPLRGLARSMSERAARAHSSGRTDEALALLREIKAMGRQIMHGEPHDCMSVLIGASIARICLKREKQIYADTGSLAGLARVEKEISEIRYLTVGNSAYTMVEPDYWISNLARPFALLIPFASIPVHAWLTILALAFWAGRTYRTRREPASELHLQATARAFTVGKLLKLYTLAFVPIAVAAFCLVYFPFLTGFHRLMLAVAAVYAVVFAPSVLLAWRASASYKKAYRDVGGQEFPKRWRDVPAPDKREHERRMAGVSGGAMLFLLVWAVFASLIIREAVGIFPWQYGRLMYAEIQKEERYVTNLLDGKVKVPQKYIREIEEREKQPAKPGGS